MAPPTSSTAAGQPAPTHWARWLVVVAGLSLSTIYFTPAIAAYFHAPLRQPVPGRRYPLAIVLGYPANPDGSPSPLLRSRVLAAVGLYQSGTVRQLLMTGGAAHTAHVEALVMAAEARRLGVPAAAILCETRARNTSENARFSAALLRRHGLDSAIVVTSPSHVPRAGWLFSHEPGCYVFQAAPYPPGTSIGWQLGADGWEHLLLTGLYLLGDPHRP